MPILSGHSVIGEQRGYVYRGFVQSPYIYGNNPNRSTFTPPQVYGYKNFGPSLNLNARFYSQ